MQPVENVAKNVLDRGQRREQDHRKSLWSCA
jgi:hypothetical protein